MSYELYVPATSGSTIYAVITRADGKYANGTTPETYNASNWTSYAVAMTETGVIGDFYATMPALPAGLYRFAAYIRAGGSPATSDVKCWVQDQLQYWDGSAFVSSAQVITGIAGTINQQSPASPATILQDADGYALVRNAAGDDIASADDVATVSTAVTDATSTIVDAVNAAGAGQGARTVLITVNDGTDPLANASVRLTSGAGTWVDSTDSDGVATLNVDDDVYTVAITLNAFSFAGATLTVTADTTHTYTMTSFAITPSPDPGQTIAYGTIRDPDGAIQVGETITLRLITPPTGDQSVYSLEPFASEESDVDGIVRATLLRNAVYTAKYKAGTAKKFATPDRDSFELPEGIWSER